MKRIRDFGGKSGRSEYPRQVRRALVRMYHIPFQQVPFKSEHLPVGQAHYAHPLGFRRLIGIKAHIMHELVKLGHVALMGRLRLYGMSRRDAQGPVRYCITEAGANYVESKL